MPNRSARRHQALSSLERKESARRGRAFGQARFARTGRKAGLIRDAKAARLWHRSAARSARGERECRMRHAERWLDHSRANPDLDGWQRGESADGRFAVRRDAGPRVRR